MVDKDKTKQYSLYIEWSDYGIRFALVLEDDRWPYYENISMGVMLKLLKEAWEDKKNHLLDLPPNIGIKNGNLYLKEQRLTESLNILESDAIGYEVGEFIYHVTPVSNLEQIKNEGFMPKDGISIDKKPFSNRLYFATSLISAYDLTVNFQSYKTEEEYVILKLTSDCIEDYTNDPLFKHGIYVDYPVSNDYIVDIIEADSLMGQFDEDDLENLYL
jgi:hypothetical protein